MALARNVRARDDLAAARLVQLFPEIDHIPELAYRPVYRPGCASLTKVAAFHDWIISEVKTGYS